MPVQYLLGCYMASVGVPSHSGAVGTPAQVTGNPESTGQVETSEVKESTGKPASEKRGSTLKRNVAGTVDYALKHRYSAPKDGSEIQKSSSKKETARKSGSSVKHDFAKTLRHSGGKEVTATKTGGQESKIVGNESRRTERSYDGEEFSSQVEIKSGVHQTNVRLTPVQNSELDSELNSERKVNKRDGRYRINVGR